MISLGGLVMMKDRLEDYKQFLIDQELSENTITQYMRDAKQFEAYRDSKPYTKALVVDYKDHLNNKYAISTTNNKLITTNKYLKFLGEDELQVKLLKEQTRGNLDNVLTQTDYNRLYRQAQQKGTPRDAMMLDCFYLTGVRVSELKFITVEALARGYIEANNKGKVRQVPISKTLEKKLKVYIKEQGITTGAIILNRSGKPLSRYYIFKRIKWLGGQARIKKSKVYPHSIRHLFAKNWLAKNGNNALQLADILGHESLDTTRIYTKLNVDELRNTME